MPKTNAERQAAYRARRNSWPTTESHMRALLMEVYFVGRDDGRDHAAFDDLDSVIERAALRYERHMGAHMADEPTEPLFAEELLGVRITADSVKRK